MLVSPMVIRPCFQGLPIGLIEPNIKNSIRPKKGFMLVSPMVIRPCFQGLPIGLIEPNIKNSIRPKKGLMLPSRFYMKGTAF